MTRPYSSRIRERLDAWWGKDHSLLARLHRLHELNRQMSAEDLDAAWHCCRHWQRTLSNKINGRTFAARHGCQTPEIYWHGRRAAAIPWNRIPEEFVLKPVWGSGSRGTYVMSGGRERLEDRPLTRQELRQEIERASAPIRWIPLLVEEHVRRPDGTYGEPHEYKLHVFRDRVEWITFVSRTENGMGSYDAEWRPFRENFSPKRPPFAVERPVCLDAMLEIAVRLGSAYGAYCRVDLFATDGGVVFNEFASTPYDGRRVGNFADEYLGQCWEEMNQRHPAPPPAPGITSGNA